MKTTVKIENISGMWLINGKRLISFTSLTDFETQVFNEFFKSQK